MHLKPMPFGTIGFRDRAGALPVHPAKMAALTGLEPALCRVRSAVRVQLRDRAVTKTLMVLARGSNPGRPLIRRLLCH